MTKNLNPPGHSQVLLDNGEYLCECRWRPTWSEVPLDEQILAHLPADEPDTVEKPSVDLNPVWTKLLAKAREINGKGERLWFRRRGFNKGQYNDVEPKWHIFADRVAVESSPYKRQWVSACNYKHVFDEYLMMAPPELWLRKGAPPVKNRCAKCIKATAQ